MRQTPPHFNVAFYYTVALFNSNNIRWILTTTETVAVLPLLWASFREIVAFQHWNWGGGGGGWHGFIFRSLNIFRGWSLSFLSEVWNKLFGTGKSPSDQQSYTIVRLPPPPPPPQTHTHTLVRSWLHTWWSSYSSTWSGVWSVVIISEGHTSTWPSRRLSNGAYSSHLLLAITEHSYDGRDS